MRAESKRRVVRVVVLVIVVVCISRMDIWDIGYKVMIVSLHGVWEWLDAPVPLTFKPARWITVAKDALFELVKK